MSTSSVAEQKKTIGIGVLGYGMRVGGIIEKLPGIGDTIRVVAVSDPSSKSIDRCREKHANPFKVYEDDLELVKDPSVDWVVIGSWNCFHRRHAVAALEAGKHVFCEKPLATNLEDCVAIAEAWRQTDRIFSMGFTLRYSAHYQKIKELIEGGAIGRLVSLEFNETLDFNHGGYIMSDWRRLRENAGTHLLEKCCHDVDLVNWMVESKAARVASFGGLDVFTPENISLQERLKPSKEGHQPYATWPSSTGLNPFTCDKDIIDNQVGILEFENGVRATFHTNCNAGIPERRMYLIGTEGAIRSDVLNGTIEYARIGFDEPRQDMSTKAKGGHGDGDGLLVRSLAESMLKGAPPLTDADDGLLSAVTVFGMDEAMDIGKVVDMKPYWERAKLKEM